ncbi:MAG: S1 RNA-binding domain-containing protein [Anaerolineae bacterium]|nr:S1 RNA-binding domain-containing protein [Anaerolineae bacterium]
MQLEVRERKGQWSMQQEEMAGREPSETTIEHSAAEEELTPRVAEKANGSEEPPEPAPQLEAEGSETVGPSVIAGEQEAEAPPRTAPQPDFEPVVREDGGEGQAVEKTAVAPEALQQEDFELPVGEDEDGKGEQEAEAKAEEKAEPATMAELMEEALDELPRFRRGDFVRGTIISKGPDEILIDIGAKSEGVVAGRELERMGQAAVDALKEGDEVLACVLRPADREGRVLLSLTRAQLEKDWRKVEQLHQAGEPIERTVSGSNKGGVIVRLGRVRGFVPASQLSREHRAMAPARSEEGEEADGEDRWSYLIGEKLLLKVVEVDRRRNRLILSERAAGREWRRQRKEELIEELRPGQVVEGRVSTLCSFGAFVDLGGADGLVHLSELAWQHVKHPSEVLQVGQQVKVQVLSVDKERSRIGLSIKRLQPEPWETVGDRYSTGQLVEGTVTKLTDFGAFAQLEDGIEGLIHVSELSDRRVSHPNEVVQEGDKVTLRIIRVEPERRRIGLSLKRVTDPDYLGMDWQFAEELEDWDVDLDGDS